mgnify:FL=1
MYCVCTVDDSTTLKLKDLCEHNLVIHKVRSLAEMTTCILLLTEITHDILPDEAFGMNDI